MTFCEKLIIEVIKILLLGGLMLLFKTLITNYFKERDNQNRIEEQRNQYRTQFIDSFINIFSSFYEIRKLYHSTFIENNYALTDKNKAELKLECLKKSAKFEGEYGSLKVRIINQFYLQKGNWETKSIKELNEQLDSQIGKKKILRNKLDLLGEYYDKWRNSIEQGIKIPLDGDTKFYNLYDEILRDLEILKLKGPGE